jgi:F0F1-type ATP synthase membrane subunit a
MRNKYCIIISSMAYSAKGFLGRYPSVSATAISVLAMAAGLLTIADILQVQLHMRHAYLIGQDMHVTLLVGLSLVYLSTLLGKRKRAAWLIAICLFGYILLRNMWYLVFHISDIGDDLLPLVGGLALPGLAVVSLFVSRDLFSVRSAMQNFTLAFSRVALVLSVAFNYGVIGFQVFDKSDLRREKSFVSTIRYTVEQPGLIYHP